MGFFSKVWKGLKKGFKKIGRVVKKGFQKFGKFMDKIGILGQIAMAFILPGIGNALIGGLGSMFGFQGITSLSQLAGNLAGSTNIFAKALGQTIGIGMQSAEPKTLFAIRRKLDTPESLIKDFLITSTCVNKPGSDIDPGTEKCIDGDICTGKQKNVIVLMLMRGSF